MKIELIKITPTNFKSGTVPTVNARELHQFLGSKKDFSSWIKSRIEQYGFIEKQDFIQLTQMGERKNVMKIEYHISIDMAKELCMVEKTSKGRQARQYFIECEHQAKQVKQPVKVEFSLEEALTIALDAVKENKELKKELSHQKGINDQFIESEDGENYTLMAAGKILGQSPRRFIKALEENKYLYRQGKILVPYQYFISRGIFEVKYFNENGFTQMQTVVTPKGVNYFAERIQEASEEEIPL